MTTDAWAPLVIAAAAIVALVFDVRDGVMPIVIGVLFIVLRRPLVRLDRAHAWWAWRMDTSDRRARITEAVFVIVGVIFVGIGVSGVVAPR